MRTPDNGKAAPAGTGTALDTAHSADSSIHDTLTVLETLGPFLTKTFKSDGSTEPYGDAASFKVKTAEITGWPDLIELLQGLHDKPKRCLIRGKLTGTEPGNKPGTFARTNANFSDQPLHWFMVDVDGFEPGFALPTDPAAVIEFIEEVLPPCFHKASYYWHMSSSAGQSPKLKCHIHFISKTAYTSAQMGAWAKQVGKQVDAAVYRRVQVHYTADPIYEEGREDPVKVRAGFHQGEEDFVDLVITADARETGAGEGGHDMKLVDPSEKEGIIGLFHRTYSAEEVLLELLEGEFSQVSERRYTWHHGGGTPEGVWVHEDGMHVGSSHNTWPIDGIANLWDLVRIFKFGDLDRADDEFDQLDIDNREIQAKPSHLAMLEWVGGLEAIKEANRAEQSLALDEVLYALRKMTTDQVLASWKAKALPLQASDAQVVVDEVARLTGRGKRPLSSELSDARKAEQRKAQAKKAAERVKQRTTLSYAPEDRTKHAHEIESLIVKTAAPGEYLNFSGVLSHVVTKPLPYTHLIDDDSEAPPPVPQIEALGKVAMLSLVERVAVFCDYREDAPKLIAVPDSIIDILIAKTEHQAPVISGLVTHPIVTGAGEILSCAGLQSNGLFVFGVDVPGCKPFDKTEAAAALSRLRSTFLDGFEFASQLDADIAIAGLITAVQRKVLDSAPGLAALAAAQSSGKTSLIKRIHVILTGHDMPALTLPSNEDEMQKRLLALLLRSPALVCFDNIPDGLSFRSAALATAITSPGLEQRILGQTKDICVNTNVMFAITGNNLRLGRDEVTRWLVCRLAPAEAKPYQRKFRNPDIVGHALANREAILRDVVGIVAGYVANGRGENLQVKSRYPRWDKLVRQPLMWAGGEDAAAIFEINEAESEDAQALSSLLSGLYALFGNDEFRASEVAAFIGRDIPMGSPLEDRVNSISEEDVRALLSDAIYAHGAKDSRSARSVGRVLAGVTSRASVLYHADQKLPARLQKRMVQGTDRYSVAF